MPDWKRAVGRRLDAIVTRTVPGVRKAVKWNSPFYGIDGQGWFLSFHCFTKYLKVTFFRGTSLRPLPSGESKHKEVRYLDIHEDDLPDEELLATWIQQASVPPGWAPWRRQGVSGRRPAFPERRNVHVLHDGAHLRRHLDSPVVELPEQRPEGVGPAREPVRRRRAAPPDLEAGDQP